MSKETSKKFKRVVENMITEELGLSIEIRLHYLFGMPYQTI